MDIVEECSGIKTDIKLIYDGLGRACENFINSYHRTRDETWKVIPPLKLIPRITNKGCTYYVDPF